VTLRERRQISPQSKLASPESNDGTSDVNVQHNALEETRRAQQLRIHQLEQEVAELRQINRILQKAVEYYSPRR
jgi:hypothetical protein